MKIKDDEWFPIILIGFMAWVYLIAGILAIVKG
jgi:hypothetical protein